MATGSSVRQLEALSRQIRHRILTMSTAAGSGHPTSSLSATDLMATLYFGGVLRYDLARPQEPGNDRVVFSKGHASPLFYALYAAAGVVKTRELLTYRKKGSVLEGHPRPNFRYAEAATGSLGQGLSIGCGLALAAKLDKLPYRTFVLLGDSELAEGSNWEAAMQASHDQLDTLIAVVDINRLGQSHPTMYGRDARTYARRFQSFGWQTEVVDGHDHAAVLKAYKNLLRAKGPAVLLAKTVKGKGVPFLEDHEGWHGKAVPIPKLPEALSGLGRVDMRLTGRISKPPRVRPRKTPSGKGRALPAYPKGSELASRRGAAEALVTLGAGNKRLFVIDPEVANSTYTEFFAEHFPERFKEAYIAEQHATGLAVGLSRRGYKPVVATFAAFLTRAHDQIRMARYSEADITFIGSHAGVSIGPDGPSQMAVEDLALFRSVPDAVVLSPADGTSAAALTALAVAHPGISYVRVARNETPTLYDSVKPFRIGGSRTLRRSPHDTVSIVATGVTVPAALVAADKLLAQNVPVRVIDAYSIQPIDAAAINRAARETGRLVVAEDHGPAGGLADAVRSALTAPATVVSLADRKVPGSATPAEQLAFQGIDAPGIMRAVKKLL